MKHIAKPPRRDFTRKQRIIRAASFWMLLALAFIVLRVLYLRFNIGVPCPIYAVTGLFCPGCGMFRAIGALVSGSLWQALHYNVLSVILLPILAIYCIRDTVRYINAAQPAPTSRPEMAFVIGAVAVSVLYAILRNIPYFEILRPHVI